MELRNGKAQVEAGSRSEDSLPVLRQMTKLFRFATRGAAVLALVGSFNAVFAQKKTPVDFFNLPAPYTMPKPSAKGPFPDGFIKNPGTWDSRALYYAHYPGLDMWATSTGVRYDFYTESAPDLKYVNGKPVPLGWNRTGHVVDLQFVGSKPAAAAGVNELGGKSTIIDVNGNSHALHNFAETKMVGIYPGVDLRLYRDQGRPRFDLIVAPNTNTGQIRFKYAGAQSTTMVNDKAMVVGTSVGNFTVSGLKAYQGDQTQTVQCGFHDNGDGTFGFAVGPHDTTKPLVIDPYVIFSTIIGGNDGQNESATSVAVANTLAPYVTGWTRDPSFPTTAGAYNRRVGDISIYVTRFSLDGQGLVASTIINSAGSAAPIRMKVDSAGRAVVVGIADANFPITVNAVQKSNTGYVMFRLNAAGTGLDISTYLGAIQGDVANDVAVDTKDNIYVAGSTSSSAFPVTSNALQASLNGARNGYIMEFDSLNTALIYASYLGGNGTDSITGIATDNQNNVGVCGSTTSSNFPVTSGALDPSVQLQDGFVTKFSTSFSSVVFSTYLGGSNNDKCDGIGFDGAGTASPANVYVYGETTSVDFPIVAGAYNNTIFNFQFFLTKLSPAGDAYLYSTFLDGAVASPGGGNRPRGYTDMVIDDRGNAYLSGVVFNQFLSDAQFAYTQHGNPLGDDDAGGDAILDVYNDSGSQKLYATNWGGTFRDAAFGVAVDRSRNAYIAGGTASDIEPTGSPFPTTWEVFRVGFFGTDQIQPMQGFLAKFRPYPGPVIAPVPGGLTLEIFDPTDSPWTTLPIDNGDNDPAITVPGTTNVQFTALLTSTPLPPAAAVHVSFSDKTHIAGPITDVKGNPYANNTAVIPQGQVITPPTGPSVPAGIWRVQTTDVADNVVEKVGVELEGQYLFRTINIVPYLRQLSLAPATVVGGDASTGNVLLSSAAPQDFTVSVSSDNPSVAVPIDNKTGATIQSITIPAGGASGIFGIKTQTVTADTTATFTVQITAPKFIAVRKQVLKIIPESDLYRVASIDLSSPTVLGGSTVTGHVTMTNPAPTGGLTVNLSSSNPTLAKLPATVYVPTGSVESGTFTIQTEVLRSTDTTVTITASRTGTNAISVPLKIRHLDITLSSVPTTIVGGGQNANFTLNLSEAPPSTYTFTLASSNSGALSVPASIDVLGGQYTAQFVATSHPVQASTNVNISAYIKNAYPGTLIAVQTITVLPVNVNLSITPSVLPSGSGLSANYHATGTVSLIGGKGSSNVVVNLSSSNTSAVTISPAQVTIPAGSVSATFNVTGHPVPFTTTSTIIASVVGGGFTSKVVTVNGPAVTNLSVDPQNIPGGGTANGTVTISLPAGSSGVNVALSSNVPGAAQVPSSVTVPAGSVTGTFTVSTATVGSDQPVVITATYPSGQSVTANIVVQAAQLASLVITPNNVVGGDSTQYPKLTVTLVNPAPQGGTVVTLFKDPNASGSPYITVPSSVTVPGGKTSSVPISLPTQVVSRSVATTITATLGGSQTVSASVTINPQ